MNIKEIEERSGLTRANIRYYEQEGLLAPARRENKYRDYSEEDLETLLRIALLRNLGFSLDEQGLTLMEYVKQTFSYQSDRVSKALAELTGREDDDA